jgi:transposase
MSNAGTIEDKYRVLAGRLDEATLRLWAAVEARSLGRGGVSTVAKAIGMSRTTIHAGLKELASASMPVASVLRASIGGPDKRRIRVKGGGRKKLTAKDTTLLRDLDALVEPTARGDPQSPLRWTCKSTPRLAKELAEQGHQVSQRSVCDLLAQLNYSLQSTRKTREGGQHPDRDAQFNHIARTAAQYQAAGDPVISVDTKKKELVGDFKNGGREWQPQGDPEQVRVHDFIDPELGKAAPPAFAGAGSTGCTMSLPIKAG